MALTVVTQPVTPQKLRVGEILTFSMHVSGEAITNVAMLRNGLPFVYVPAEIAILPAVFPIVDPTNVFVIYAHPNAQPNDSDRYALILTSTSGLTQSSDVYAMVANSHLKQIAEEIRLLILSMKITDGYNFDWKSANEMDNALVQFWPSPVIRYKTEATSGSRQLDLYGMANAEFIIEMQPNEMTPNEPHPILAADAYYDQCVADLRRLFFGNPPATAYGYLALSGESVITYKDKIVEDFAAGDTSRPGKLTTRWNVFYHVY